MQLNELFLAIQDVRDMVDPHARLVALEPLVPELDAMVRDGSVTAALQVNMLIQAERAIDPRAKLMETPAAGLAQLKVTLDRVKALQEAS